MNKNYLSFDDIQKLHDEKTANRIICKNCGHTMNISNSRDKRICSHCGKYVFREEKDEFKYRLLNSYKGARKEV